MLSGKVESLRTSPGELMCRAGQDRLSEISSSRNSPRPANLFFNRRAAVLKRLLKRKGLSRAVKKRRKTGPLVLHAQCYRMARRRRVLSESHFISPFFHTAPSHPALGSLRV